MKHRIFIPLASDAAVLREVDAVPAGEGRFRITGAAPNGERLQFERGEIVECEIHAVPGGRKELVAIRSVSAEPEFRKRRNVFAVCGALVGGIVGAVFTLQVDLSIDSAAMGFLVGAVVFGFCSARWGDAAWDTLSRMFDWHH